MAGDFRKGAGELTLEKRRQSRRKMMLPVGRKHQTEREDGKMPSLLPRSFQVGRGARRKRGQMRLVQRGCLGSFLCYLQILRKPVAKLHVLPQAPQVALPEIQKSES